jgi:hypothetical protein
MAIRAISSAPDPGPTWAQRDAATDLLRRIGSPSIWINWEATDLWREAYRGYLEIWPGGTAMSDLGHFLSDLGLLVCEQEGGYLYDAYILDRPASLDARLRWYGRQR